MELNKEPEKDTVELDNIAPETETETAIIENQPEPLEEQGLEEVEVEIVAEPVSVENTVAPDEIEKSEVDLALDLSLIHI